MKQLIKPAIIIAWKDLYLEWKTKQNITTMLIFSGLVIVTFSFAFDPTNEAVRVLVPGMIWIITFFAGILGLNSSFALEKQDDRVYSYIVAPIDPASVYIGKSLANFFFVFMTQLISIPLLFVLFDFHLIGYGKVLQFFVVLLLGTFGFIVVGTLVAALASHTKSSQMLLPILLFPLVTPVVIAAVQATKIILIDKLAMTDALSWVQLLAVYDIIFFVVGFLLFEYVLEV